MAAGDESGSVFVYPVAPFPNTTYQFSEEVRFPFSFAFSGTATARRYGYSFRWDLSTPDRAHESLVYDYVYFDAGEDDRESDNLLLSSATKALVPGRYQLTWTFSIHHCYTQAVSRWSSGTPDTRGRGGGHRWKTDDEKETDNLDVSGSFDFALDAKNGTGSQPYVSIDEQENSATLAPGTFIAEILGPYEDDPDCPRLNPQDWAYNATTTRPPDPSRTDPDAPVPTRETTVPAEATPVQTKGTGPLLDTATSVEPSKYYTRLVPLLLGVWLLAGMGLVAV